MSTLINKEQQKYIAAVLGLVVGDALGVPAEFKSRSLLKKKPVTTMQGYGTHNQPPRTWSDDSSMAIATLEWLGEMKENQPDYELLMDKFNNWLMHGEYTPYGEVFDCGIATNRAIRNYRMGIQTLQCGCKSEWENGNGSLMRILPAALWCHDELVGEDIKATEFIYNVSALTHGHMRSKMGCLIYSKIIADLLANPTGDKFELVKNALSICRQHFDSMLDREVTEETKIYSRLWDLETFQKLDEDDIKSSGYVVYTLEAAIWCFLNTDTYKDCVLKAVNLGEDTDTVGAVAGGLAGLYYGIDEIPAEWIALLPKKEWIMELVEKMYGKKVK